MSISKRILGLLIALFFSASASAQQLFFDGKIATDFDNTEYAGSGLGSSRTIFAVSIKPEIGYRFNEHHTMVVGAELLKDFGSKRFIDEAKLVAYYRFRNEKFGASAGIFERDQLVGRYSRAFFSDEYLIYHPLVQGVAMQYTGPKAFTELAVDWEGLYSPDTREQFRILFAAGGKFGRYFDAGVSMSIQHFANKSTFKGNVVDNVLINPYIGAKFTAFFDWEFRLGYLQTMQQDRHLDEGWKVPMGGEFYFKFTRWGVFIDNNLYYGKNLAPMYHNLGNDGLKYGSALYSGDPFYGTRHNIYNRTGIGYERKFVGDRVSVRAEMVLQTDGTKLYCQQLIGVSARICPTLYDKAKHKK